MTYRNIIAYDTGQVIGNVQNTAVLYIAARANHTMIDIATGHCIIPDGGFLATAHSAQT